MDAETTVTLVALRELLSHQSSAAERAALLERVVSVFYQHQPGPAEPEAARETERRAIGLILDRATTHLHATQFTRS